MARHIFKFMYLYAHSKLTKTLSGNYQSTRNLKSLVFEVLRVRLETRLESLLFTDSTYPVTSHYNKKCVHLGCSEGNTVALVARTREVFLPGFWRLRSPRPSAASPAPGKALFLAHRWSYSCCALQHTETSLAGPFMGAAPS